VPRWKRSGGWNPRGSSPDSPGAWLMTAARHRGIDRLRRNDRLAGRVAELGREAQELQRLVVFDGLADFDAVLDDDALKDDILRLIFVACHPVLPIESRVALTLRLLGGLTTAEIARAFLATEPTVAQRIVRAKRTLADKRDPVEPIQPHHLLAANGIVILCQAHAGRLAQRRVGADRPTAELS
jgi:RNA polymerase sigma factor (sigma-70 family)